jgi:hypothetical protein
MQSGAGNVSAFTFTPPSSTGAAQPLFRGEDGLPTLDDVVDIINPLQHIPFVSTLYNQWADNEPSTGAKLAGGALVGGPIGFVASLANVIFEGITGKDIGETVIAAFSDAPEPEQQLASATDAYEAAPVMEVAGQEILPPPSASLANAAAPTERFVLASTAQQATPVDMRVLDLYGGSQSANRAYQRAQLRPYLQDVSQSMVL